MKLLRLPSGQFVDVSKIINTDEEIRPHNHKDGGVIFQVFVNYPTEDGVAAPFFDADARALYAWLVANSTAIGEDGREVATELRVDIHLSRSQVALLKGMMRYGSIAASRIVDISANLSSLEFSQLIEDGLIVKEDNDAIRIGNWYVITDIGRAAIEGK